MCPEKTDLVVEIGPGKGALTDHLLGRADRVVAIEIDPVLVQYLRSKYRDDPRVEIIESDILKADLSHRGPLTVAGNLPYYITSPIVEKVLGVGRQVHRAVFLVQKEVAERMTTGPGSRDYGYLSVATQFYAEARLLFTVPPGAFRPPPKVDSAVISLTPRTELAVAEPQAFLRFAGHCFRQKRKTLRNNLLGIWDKDKLDALPQAGMRAEQLSIAELVDLFRRMPES